VQRAKTSAAQAEEFFGEGSRLSSERFFYFLEAEKQYGLLVMDEVENLMIGGSSGSWKLTWKGRRQAAIEPVGLYLCTFRCVGPHVPNPSCDLLHLLRKWGFAFQPWDVCGQLAPRSPKNWALAWSIAVQWDGYRDGEVLEVGACFVSNPYAAGAHKKRSNAVGTARKWRRSRTPLVVSATNY